MMVKQSNNTRCCTDCRTTMTPLWRGGPAGPKSLCNACGIRYRKRKRVMEGMGRRRRSAVKKKYKAASNGGETTSKTTVTNTAKSASGKVDSNNATAAAPTKCATSSVNGSNESLKMRLMALGKEVLLQRSASAAVVVKKQRCQRRRRLKEEEQAAFSLMALSCGVVFA